MRRPLGLGIFLVSMWHHPPGQVRGGVTHLGISKVENVLIGTKYCSIPLILIRHNLLSTWDIQVIILIVAKYG